MSVKVGNRLVLPRASSDANLIVVGICGNLEFRPWGICWSLDRIGMNVKQNLLLDLWGDLHQTQILWQVGALSVCMALAWWADRLYRHRRSNAGTPDNRAMEILQRGLQRLVFPVVALLLVLGMRPLLAHWHSVNLLSLALPLFASLAAIRLVFFGLRMGVPGALWLASFEKIFAVLVWGVVAMYISGVLPDVIELLESTTFGTGKQKLTLWTLIQGLGAVLVGVLAALWLGGMVEARLMAAEGIDTNLRVVFARLSKALLLVAAFLIGLPMVGIDLTMLSVFGGALGVGLGLGLQRIAANYISGFIILLDHSIRIGNLIQVGTSRGVVTRITTRYTVLLDRDGHEMLVPNELLVGGVIVNETHSDPRIRVPLQIQVAYGSDLERVQSILIDVAVAQPRVLRDPVPIAHVLAFADSGVSMELRFWINDPEEGTGQIKSAINLAIWKRFQAEGIKIPFPQREIRVLDAKVGAGETAL